jgi:hypothetical protein
MGRRNGVMSFKDIADRFWDRAIPEPNSGCWLWSAGTSPLGYGILYFDGSNRLAHRIAYEMLVGPIPKGLELDHLCRVRCCVNPDHLEPVPHAENVRRSPVVGRVDRGITHCPQGHPYKINTANSRRRRVCPECRRRRDRDRYRRKKFGGTDGRGGTV